MNIKVILTELLVGVMIVILAILPFVMPNTPLKISTIAIFLLFCFIGYLLIKSTLREVEAKKILEQKVKERTKELEREKKLAEVHREIAEERARRLERFYQSAVGGELKMVELKKKIEELEEKLRKRE